VGNLKKRLERLEGGRRGTAFVVVKPGQTQEEAWQEHLALHPEDEQAEKVFFLNYH
jgi:hypothetical protein